MNDATGGDLQFETAEVGEGHADPTACAYCGGGLTPSYWVVDDRPACPRCQRQAAQRGTGGSGAGRFVRACVFGALAGALGAGIWYGIREVSGYEIGLISILVGWLVGVAVRIGSRERGGRLYQALAVFIAYSAIVSTYIPLIVKEMRTQWEQSQAAATPSGDATTAETSAPQEESAATEAPAVEEAPATPQATGALPEAPEATAAGALVALVLFTLFVVVVAYAAPFLGGFENLLGIAIIAFGVWEAWRINRRVEPQISGPFRIGGSKAAAAAAVPGVPGV